MTRRIPFIITSLTLALMAMTFSLLWHEVMSITEMETGMMYPVDRLQILFFLSKPLLIIAPFLLSITILGAYFLTRQWMKNVIINVISDTYNRRIAINKTKYLNEEERKVFEIITRHGNEVYQSELVTESELSKYKVSRILKRFELLGIVKREKYGITNVVYPLVEIGPGIDGNGINPISPEQ